MTAKKARMTAATKTVTTTRTIEQVRAINEYVSALTNLDEVLHHGTHQLPIDMQEGAEMLQDYLRTVLRNVVHETLVL